MSACAAKSQQITGIFKSYKSLSTSNSCKSIRKKNLCSLVISTDALIRSAGFIQEQDLSLEETQKDLRKQFLTSNNVAQGVSTIFIQAIYHLG